MGDDLDAMLAEFATKDSTCAFGTCNVKVHTLMDAISKCKYCNQRFCVAHAQAEVHGCGEIAQRSERQKWQKDCASALNPSGSGLVNKACGDKRGNVASKLQEKIQSSQAARTVKKKEA